MLTLTLQKQSHSLYRILCLGAHCDDIEIGCGGTILKLLEIYRNSTVYWAVFSSNQQRAREANECAHMFLQDAKSKNIIIRNLRDGFFPFLGTTIKEYFEQLKSEFHPDIIFTHYRGDLHQDHRLVSELTWNTFRDHLILEYEIPKYDGDFGSPNFFVHLDEPAAHRKIQHIMSKFSSQLKKDWFDKETFLAMLRLRGMESRSPSKYAEAFYCRKLLFL
jgi:LmbE family N-acetylglucosaminyl deacetylase